MTSSLERRLPFYQKLIDLLVVWVVWGLVYALRFRVFSGQTGIEGLFIVTGLLLGFLTIWSFSREGLYRSQRLHRRTEVLLSLLRANFWVVICFVVLLYFFGNERLSRASILLYAVLSTVAFATVRLSARAWLARLRRRGEDRRAVLLIGHGAAIESYVRTIQAYPDAGIFFPGWIDSRGLAAALGVPEFSGGVNDGKAALYPQSVVVSYPPEEWSRVQDLMRDTYNDVVPIIVLPEFPYAVLGLNLESWSGLPAFVLNQPEYPPVDLLLKRLMDLIGAGLGLLILSPLLALIAVGVKLSSAGPIFFAQERIGLDGRRFKMWKFRSMRVTAEAESTWTTKDDPRKTRFGSFLRASSLDELPQLWNIFTGEMSIVGPRPEQPRYVEQFRHEIPAYMLRHKMKAGLTGWAQVNGWRGDTDLVKRIECDLYYIRHWSLWLDVKIIFLTFLKGFINKNAY